MATGGTPSPTGAALGRGKRFGIAVARFHEPITERLLEGAINTLQQQGVAAADIEVVRVPGAFELPTACRWLADTGRFHGLLALGAVVRGGTDHYEYVCSGVTDGVMRVALDTGLPLGFGVLTCAAMDQALARAGGEHGNKGADAAMAALEMAAIRDGLPPGGG